MILKKALIQEIINESMETGADFAEVFLEESKTNSIQAVGLSVEKNLYGVVKGIGLRIAKGLYSVYGYTNDLSRDSVLTLAKKLRASFSGEKQEVVPLGELMVGKHHKVKILPTTVESEKKVSLVLEAAKEAKDYDEEITQTQVYYMDKVQDVVIANNSGLFVSDQRVYSRISIVAIASDGKSMQTGHVGPGAHMGFEFFDTINIKEQAREAARIAKIMLHADFAPSGEFPVVLDNGFGGVIFHEACGHSLEATSVAKNASVFSGKFGTQIANPIVNAVDDGTIENSWGSENFDDEGHPQQKRQLITNGILTSYMIDELNSRRMGMPATGSGRRESYKYAPTSRMSNTYICNGESTFEELFEGIELGFYAKSLGGGSVNPATGDFNFSVNEGYMIRNGQIAEPVRGAALVGTGAETLLKIDKIANNCLRAQGVCGSLSGSINADVGQPTIRVSKMTVGGRKEAK